MTAESPAYENCFLAVPLDERHAESHRELSETLAAIPELTVDDPETPHVTVCYLGDQPKTALAGILAAAEEVAAALEVELTIGGHGTFSNKKQIFYLAVEADPELAEASRKLDRRLEEISHGEDYGDFTPHLTVARAKPDALDPERLAELRTLLDGIEWSFPAGEIALYGTPPGESARRILDRRPCPRLA